MTSSRVSGLGVVHVLPLSKSMSSRLRHAYYSCRYSVLGTGYSRTKPYSTTYLQLGILVHGLYTL